MCTPRTRQMTATSTDEHTPGEHSRGSKSAEEDYLQLSGIQHYAYCPRQWGLIYLEGQWQDNLFTFHGTALHRKADRGAAVESRGELITCRAVPLVSHCLGISGRADVIEFLYCGEQQEPQTVMMSGRSGWWRPYPVEYKRGRPKSGGWDHVQLCAQAICLEEMLGVPVLEGAMYYGRTRRRHPVRFDSALRMHVAELAREMHALTEAGETPRAPARALRCRGCSLIDVCVPKLTRRTKRLGNYMRDLLSKAGETVTDA